MTACIGIVDILIQGVLLGILLPRIGERGVIVSGIVAQTIGLVALALVASLFAQPWVFIVGALMLAAGQGASQAAMDGAMSNAVGDDEQGWLGGATQSLKRRCPPSRRSSQRRSMPRSATPRPIGSAWRSWSSPQSSSVGRTS